MSADAIAACLNNGFDPSSFGENQEAGAPVPLYAVQANPEPLALFKAMLDAGADPHALSPIGHSALIFVWWLPGDDEVKKSIVLDLVNAGLDVNFLNEKYGVRPLHAAMGAAEHPDTALWFMEQGAKLSMEGDQFGALASAVSNTRFDLGEIKLLIDRFGHQEGSLAVPARTVSALNLATSKLQSAEVIDYLLELGLDPNVRSQLGLTAWDYAKMKPAQYTDFLLSAPKIEPRTGVPIETMFEGKWFSLDDNHFIEIRHLEGAEMLVEETYWDRLTYQVQHSSTVAQMKGDVLSIPMATDVLQIVGLKMKGGKKEFWKVPSHWTYDNAKYFITVENFEDPPGVIAP